MTTPASIKEHCQRLVAKTPGSACLFICSQDSSQESQTKSESPFQQWFSPPTVNTNMHYTHQQQQEQQQHFRYDYGQPPDQRSGDKPIRPLVGGQPPNVGGHQYHEDVQQYENQKFSNVSAAHYLGGNPRILVQMLQSIVETNERSIYPGEYNEETTVKQTETISQSWVAQPVYSEEPVPEFIPRQSEFLSSEDIKQLCREIVNREENMGILFIYVPPPSPVCSPSFSGNPNHFTGPYISYNLSTIYTYYRIHNHKQKQNNPTLQYTKMIIQWKMLNLILHREVILCDIWWSSCYIFIN
jgi:hypothetical protein